LERTLLYGFFQGGNHVKHTAASLACIALAVLFAPQVSNATNGGSGGYQSEAREDDYYYGGCYTNACAGRCGAGCSTAFGTTVTYACQQHDNCIRDNKCSGKSTATAHVNCLSGSRGLGKAAASLIGYHWNNAVSYVSDTLSSTPWVRVGT
jgi:hypothetical protein